MGKVGEITRVAWYEFADGTFSFHTARDDKATPNHTTFRSRRDTWPSKRAADKGIRYDFMRNSSEVEIKMWLAAHPDYPIKKVITV